MVIYPSWQQLKYVDELDHNPDGFDDDVFQVRIAMVTMITIHVIKKMTRMTLFIVHSVRGLKPWWYF